jgi:hypothetical protein
MEAFPNGQTVFEDPYENVPGITATLPDLALARPE